METSASLKNWWYAIRAPIAKSLGIINGYENPMNLTICEPGELTPEDLKICLCLIRDGGAVGGMKTAARMLPQSVIAIVRDAGSIVAMGAIKSKRPPYVSKIAQRSRFQFSDAMLELGYISVRKSHREKGLSKSIVAALVSRFKAEPLFATTSAERMASPLRLAGFVKQGQEWNGGGGTLSLWIRD